MDLRRALDIYHDQDSIAVQLDGEPVWIEHVDEVYGMATVQVGSKPTNTHTVSVERLQKKEK
ncbi:small acid-soluble spore protein H (minor) [Paenibacillus sp. DS2015]|uniref:H-type small acid-soluble spore protein n=1 Tax=Paenibacillus sp. DS2015 TaxID=3373917 RepID=UPI003D1B5136